MLEDNVLKVDETATIGAEITVVVKSLVSGKTSEYTLTIAKLKQTAELTERKTIDLDLSVENGALKAGDITLDLSEGSEYIGNNRIVVKYGDAILYDGEGANEVNVSADAVKGLFGENNFMVLVYGTEIDYELSLPVNIISKTIKTKADLDGWQEIASYIAVEANLCPADAFRQYMTGYFVLGADISYNATFVPFTPFSTYWSLGNQGVNGVKYGDGEWNHGTSYGFKGVFDGCGYNIDGMKVAGNLNGFIVTLANGTIKNVSFTNASVSDASSLIVKAGIGTIENVYVQYNSITNATEAGTFFSTGSDNARSVKNCIIDVTDCKFESATNVKLIGADAQHGEEKVVYDGIYVVGTYPSNVTLKDQKADCCAIGAFGTYAELLADETAAAKIAAFDASVWAKNENLVIFKRLFDADNVTPAITNEEAEIIKGISVKLTSNAKYVKYSLDGEIEGVSVNGNVLSVAEDVADDTEITVVVTSLINGKSANFTFTVKSAGSAYVIGTPIDMNGVTLGSLDGFGLSSFWVRNVAESPENLIGYTDKVAEFYNYNGSIYGDMFAHGASVSLNDSLTVKDGMNYIKLRMYISHETLASVNLRFYRSDRTNHEVETGVWFDYVADVATNGWFNVYLPVSKFAVDGKIDGFKFACFTSGTDTARIYIDDVTVQSENYTLGDVIDVDGVTLGGVDGFGLSSFWARDVIDSADGITGYNGKVARIRNYNGSVYGDMFAHAANITLNNPVTVKDGMNYVRVRFYVSYSAAESLNLRFYRSDRTNHEVEAGVWFDYVADVATNGWVNVYLPVSKFAVDGQINGFKFGCFTNTGDNAEIYIDDITIVDIAGTKATLNGGTVSYPAGIPGNPFGCTDSTATTITSDSWEIAGGNDYCNAMITFATPLKITTEKTILVRFRMSKAMNSGSIAFFNVNKEHKASYTDGYPVDDYVTVTLTLSDFATDGELKGLSIGLWGSASNVSIYLDYIAIA